MSNLKTIPLGPGNDAPKSIINQVVGLPAGVEANSKEHCEWLMRERFELLALWPNCPETITKECIGKVYAYDRQGTSESGSVVKRSDYPHLFRRLEWWEHREPGQMPGYVKKENGGGYVVLKGHWRHATVFHTMIDGRLTPIHVTYLKPATAAEYEKGGGDA